VLCIFNDGVLLAEGDDVQSFRPFGGLSCAIISSQ
jgi:hypothetical protein